MLSRVCRECGCSFLGGPRAWYCTECRKKRIKIQNQEFKKRKRAGEVIPNGSVIKCALCGKDIIKNSGVQRFCDECAAKHLKEIDNQQSLRWKMDNPDKIKESKRKLSKKKYASGEALKSGVPGVSWDKSKQRWKACINYQGKQYVIVSAKSKDLAIQARREAEQTEFSGIDQIERLKQKYKDMQKYNQ